jgi:hypothetical protein
MLGKPAKDEMRRPWKVAVTLLCALLLIFGATVQVSHVHSGADVSHAGCTLCATAHVVVSPATPVAAPLVARKAATPVLDLQPSRARNFLPFSLYHRPPPVAFAFA